MFDQINIEELAKIKRISFTQRNVYSNSEKMDLYLNNCILAYFSIQQNRVEYLQVGAFNCSIANFDYDANSKWLIVLKDFGFYIEEAKRLQIQSSEAEELLNSYLDLYQNNENTNDEINLIAIHLNEISLCYTKDIQYSRQYTSMGIKSLPYFTSIDIKPCIFNKCVVYEISFLKLKYNAEQVKLDLETILINYSSVIVNLPHLNKFDDIISILKLFLPDPTSFDCKSQNLPLKVVSLRVNFSIDFDCSNFEEFLTIVQSYFMNNETNQHLKRPLESLKIKVKSANDIERLLSALQYSNLRELEIDCNQTKNLGNVVGTIREFQQSHKALMYFKDLFCGLPFEKEYNMQLIPKVL